MEETTPEETGAVNTAQPEEAAVDAQTSTDDDTELMAWADKKGLKVDDPVAILKVARQAEQNFHSARQTPKQEQQQIEDASVAATEQGDPLLDKVSALEARLMVKDFFDTTPDASKYRAEMAALVKERPYLAQDLQVLYTVAKANDSQVKATATAKAELARESTASAPRANATTPSRTSGEWTDDKIGALSPNEYKANREAILAWQQQQYYK